MNLVVEADGGSRGNPGPAGYGAVVKAADGEILAETADAIGVATNNIAEYQGLIAGLRSALAVGGDGATVEVRMDSKLVIEQMAGRWKIKNERLRPLALEAGTLARRLRVTWKWIPRERNRDADRLANEAMDAAAKGTTWRSGTPPTTQSGTTSPRGAATPPATTERASPPPGSPFGRSFPTTAHPSSSTAEPLFDLTPEPASSAAAEPSPSITESTSRRTTGGGWRGPSTTATSFLLLRHGETPFSVDRRFSGTGDPELTPTGQAQAEAAATRLSAPPYAIDVIVSSPLRRARATAEAVAARTGAPILVEEPLREVDFGDWEGHTFTEIQRHWPGELKSWLADPAVPPPGGESFAEATERVSAARDRLLLDHNGKTILIVSHVTPIKILLRLALLAPPEALYRMHLDVASLSAVDHFPDGPDLVTKLNDTSHLP
ncbi:bifunctional RNase H/acid phosphatase [Sphaerisporangium rubeum]|uniref:Putative phosphoglycerate mutase n=1 Tax=Sphaerisporangium rubeum TaxID=321317 RepID=A0A7X0IFJ3_9ACTN|nr:putative phosphoglycerate mutase [Sphaerisporangium rubeum]